MNRGIFKNYNEVLNLFTEIIKSDFSDKSFEKARQKILDAKELIVTPRNLDEIRKLCIDDMKNPVLYSRFLRRIVQKRIIDVNYKENLSNVNKEIISKFYKDILVQDFSHLFGKNIMKVSKPDFIKMVNQAKKNNLKCSLITLSTKVENPEILIVPPFTRKEKNKIFTNKRK